MGKIRRLRVIFVLIVATFLVYAPIEKFYVPIMTLFPFYHWELGFGHISKNSFLFDVEIKSLNEKEVSPPISVKEWAEQNHYWSTTADYMILLQLGLGIRRNDDRGRQQKRTFEERFFRSQSITSATYEVFYVRFDPLDKYLNGKIFSKESVGVFEYDY